MSFQPHYGPVPLRDLVSHAHKELAMRNKHFEKYPWKYSPIYCAVELQRLEWNVVALELLQKALGADAVLNTESLPLERAA